MMSGIIMKSSEILPSNVSKELEKVNFETLAFASHPDLRESQNEIYKLSRKDKYLRWISKNEVHPEDKKVQFNETESDSQVVTFQKAMKLLFIFGQCLGLKPLVGSLQTNVNNMRFTVRSWKFIHSIIMGAAQTTALILCVYRLLKGDIYVGSIAYIAFYLSASTTTYLMIQVSSKWPKLMKKLSNSRLDEYTDPGLKFKCFAASCIIILMACLEHILSTMSLVAQSKDCYSNPNIYEQYFMLNFPWYTQLGLPINEVIGVFLQIVNIMSTMNWNYSDLFIICLSMFLQSILKKINIKVMAASEKRYIQSSHWRSLREDYNNAVRLVRSFDDVISGVMFCSFASNLFFICLQIYNILGYGIKTKPCPNNSELFLNGHQLTIYLIFSLTYLLARSLTVSMIVADVNTASLEPVTALYNVPSSAYCSEVQRFIEQVNGDMVALSGLKFFYVTRDLVLSVAGTIVTYELVLLQFSYDDD